MLMTSAIKAGVVGIFLSTVSKNGQEILWAGDGKLNVNTSDANQNSKNQSNDEDNRRIFLCEDSVTLPGEFNKIKK